MTASTASGSVMSMTSAWWATCCPGALSYRSTAMTSTPSRWKAITTSLPSSPAPSRSTLVAVGLSGVPRMSGGPTVAGGTGGADGAGGTGGGAGEDAGESASGAGVASTCRAAPSPAALSLFDVIPKSYFPRDRSPHHLVPVAPTPHLTRFGRPHHRMPGLLEVGGGVPARAGIAASDVTTRQAHPQMCPVMFAEFHTSLAGASVARPGLRVARRVDADLAELGASRGRGRPRTRCAVRRRCTLSAEDLHGDHYCCPLLFDE